VTLSQRALADGVVIEELAAAECRALEAVAAWRRLALQSLAYAHRQDQELDRARAQCDALREELRRYTRGKAAVAA
jgi:hypothetical protein